MWTHQLHEQKQAHGELIDDHGENLHQSTAAGILFLQLITVPISGLQRTERYYQ
jgi:hypothetical protein